MTDNESEKSLIMGKEVVPQSHILDFPVFVGLVFCFLVWLSVGKENLDAFFGMSEHDVSSPLPLLFSSSRMFSNTSYS